MIRLSSRVIIRVCVILCGVAATNIFVLMYPVGGKSKDISEIFNFHVLLMTVI